MSPPLISSIPFVLDGVSYTRSIATDGTRHTVAPHAGMRRGLPVHHKPPILMSHGFNETTTSVAFVRRLSLYLGFQFELLLPLTMTSTPSSACFFNSSADPLFTVATRGQFIRVHASLTPLRLPLAGSIVSIYVLVDAVVSFLGHMILM